MCVWEGIKYVKRIRREAKKKHNQQEKIQINTKLKRKIKRRVRR